MARDALTELVAHNQRMFRDAARTIAATQDHLDKIRPLVASPQIEMAADVARRLADQSATTQAAQLLVANDILQTWRAVEVSMPQFAAIAEQLDGAMTAAAVALSQSQMLDQIARLPDLAAQVKTIYTSIGDTGLAAASKAFETVRSFQAELPNPRQVEAAFRASGMLNGAALEAYGRFVERAESLGRSDSSHTDDATELAQGATDFVTAVPPAARRAAAAQLILVLVWLLKQGGGQVAIEGVKALYALIIALHFAAQPQVPTRPDLLPAPAGLDVVSEDGAWKGRTRGAILPPFVARAGPLAASRTLDFFATEIRSPHTRAAYQNALVRFFEWCEDRKIALLDVAPFTVSAYVDELQSQVAPTTARQHLAAIRRYFQYLANGGALPLDPAEFVRIQTSRSVGRKAPAATRSGVMRLLDSIEPRDPSGVRDRALIAVLADGDVRVSSLLGMRVEDFAREPDGASLRVAAGRGVQVHRVSETAARLMDAYRAAAELESEPATPMWRALTKQRTFGVRPMSRFDVFRMIQRRTAAAGLDDRLNAEALRGVGLS